VEDALSTRARAGQQIGQNSWKISVRHVAVANCVDPFLSVIEHQLEALELQYSACGLSLRSAAVHKIAIIFTRFNFLGLLAC
jgi:hypothetical protein